MNSSNSVSGASPSIAPPTRSFNVLLADGSRLRVTCQDLAAQLRQERSATLKRLRQTRAEALADIADRVSEARIRREFKANERAMDAAIRRLSRQVRVRPEPPRTSSSSRPSPSRPVGTGHSGIVFTRRTTSALARRDRLGREGIMLRIRYVRAGGKHASPGCLRRHWRYIAREAAVALDGDGEPIVLGNMGVTIEEVAGALDLQEQVLREMRKNAKLGFRMIGAFPYGLPADARRAVLQRIGDELFGARDLPWYAAAHDADPGAEADNPHFHLDYGLLPMARQADGSFVISNDLRTDLDGQEGLRFIRHTVARVMTEVAQEQGLDRSFTALSYRERGMDREGGEHVGQEGTAAHRRGEHVATIARNEARQRRAEARERSRKACERLDALERLKRAIEAMPASPSMTGDLADLVEGAVPAPEMAPVAATPMMVTNIPVLASVPIILPKIVPDAEATAPCLADGPPLAVVDRPAPDLASSPSTADDLSAATFLSNVAPSIDMPAARVTVAVASAPTMGTTLPAVSDFAVAPDSAIVVNAFGGLGSEAPTADAVPVIAATGYSAPRMVGTALSNREPTVAPPIDVVPALTEAGRALATIAPPVVTLFGSPARYPSVGSPIISAVGRQASIDPADEVTEQLLADAIDREEARRRAAAIEEAEQRDRRNGDAAGFEALRREDEWLGQDDEGRYTVSDAALRASGLSRVDLHTPAAQAALEAIGFGQVDRLGPVLDDRSGRPVFHVDGGAIRLDDRFPAGLRDDVTRWGDNPHFRAFAVKIWPELREALVPAPNAATAAEEQRRRARDELFSAIAEERHSLGREHGAVVVHPRLLARFGLSPADVTGEAERKRIAELADRQAAEVSQIASHVQTSPQDIVPDGDGWRLDDTAPADVRMLVAAWRNDATMQQALGRAATARPAVAPPKDVAQPAAEHLGAAWRRARLARERAMAESDAVERRDGNGLAQPGRRIVRPGAEDLGDTSYVARRFPGLPGRGIGD